MKMEIWPDDVGMPEMTDWLAELRDDGHAEAAEDGPEGRAGADEASPEVSVPAQADGSVSSDQASAPAKTSSPGQISLPDETGATGQMSLPDETGATGQISLPADTGPIGEISLPAETGAMDRPWPPAETGATVPTWPTTDTSPTGRIRVPAEDSPTGRVRFPAEASPRSRTRHSARPSAAAEITERAVIGDQLRMPIVWCEMGSCISWHADHAALGEADIRARAIGAGWRVDALGRLACPRCQQTASGFRVSRPVVLWDRHAAITRAARMAGLRGNGAAGERGRDPRPPASHRLPASPPEPERRREHPAAKATVGRHAR